MEKFFRKLYENVQTRLSKRRVKTDHDLRSVEIAFHLRYLDRLNGDQLALKFGGDGDNGEHLMDLLDVFFETREIRELSPRAYLELIICNVVMRGDDRLHVEDLNQCAERMPALYLEIAKILGVNASEVKRVVAEGGLSLERLEAIKRGI